VSAPFVLGRVLLVSALADFYERYPALLVELELTDRLVQFAEENVDVALRIGPLGDSQATVRRLARTRWVTVASPGYLGRHGTPQRPSDLSAHQCLRFLAPDGRPRDWTFTGRERQESVAGRLVANDGEALVAAAVAGVGLVQAMGFMVRPAVSRGELVEVLAEHAAEGPSIYVLSAPGRTRAARVKAFLDLVRELFGGAH
jgi:DNA-binding transcriptional LysR family regulator